MTKRSRTVNEALNSLEVAIAAAQELNDRISAAKAAAKKGNVR